MGSKVWIMSDKQPDYEGVCDEWLEYISSLSFEDRKEKFIEYLEASGVFDVN